MIKIISLIVVSSFLVACNDGSNSEPVIPDYKKNNIYYYTKNISNGNTYRSKKNLIAYDQSANSSLNITTAGSNFNYDYLDYFILNKTLYNYKYKGVYYAQNGMLYTATEDTTGSLITRQLSSLTTANDNCGAYISAKFFIFSETDVNGDCLLDVSNVAYYVTPEMDESSQAVKLNTMPLVSIVSYTSTSIDLLSWLMFYNNELWLYNKDFSSSKSIGTGFTRVDSITGNLDYKILNIDGEIRSYNIKTSQLSASLHTVVSATSIYNLTSSLSTFFFSSGNNFYSLDYDGKTKSRIIATESISTSEINILTTVDNSLLYISRDTTNSMYNLSTVDISSGKINKLVTSASLIKYLGHNSSRIYYNRGGNGIDKGIAGVVNVGGNGKQEKPDSLWVGVFSPITLSLDTSDYPIESIVLNELVFDTNNKVTGGTLYSYDARNNTRKFFMGILPADVVSAKISGIGSSGIGQYKRTDSSTDVFYLDVNLEQSLIRITNTDVYEQTLNYYDF